MTFTPGQVLTAAELNALNPGLMFLAAGSISGATTVSLPTASFTSEFNRYLMLGALTPDNEGEMLMRMRAAGADTSGTAYETTRDEGSSSGPGATNAASASAFRVGYGIAATPSPFRMLLHSPHAAEATVIQLEITRDGGSGALFQQSITGKLRNSTAYDAASFLSNAGGNVAVEYALYGYRAA